MKLLRKNLIRVKKGGGRKIGNKEVGSRKRDPFPTEDSSFCLGKPRESKRGEAVGRSKGSLGSYFER